MVHAHDDILLDASLTPASAPLLVEACTELFDLLRECEVNARDAIGFGSAEALLRQHSSLRALRSVGLVDAAELQASMDELASPEAAIGLAGLPPAARVDRFLVPAVLLGLARFPAAQRRLPDWLPRAVAALLAVDAWLPLIAPDLAPDILLNGPGCHTNPRIGRMLPAGHLLARVVGYEALAQGVAGLGPLLDGIDEATLAAAEALMHPGVTIDGAALPAWTQRFEEQDAAWLEDIVQSMCARRRREEGLPRAYMAVPDGGGLVLELQTCRLRVLAPATLGQTTAQGWLEQPPAAISAPPAACGALDRAGWPDVEIRFEHVDALEDMVEVLFDLCDQAGEVQLIQGDGFTVGPHDRSAA